MHEFSAKIQKKKSQTDQKSDKLPSFFANHPCKFGVFELSEKKFFYLSMHLEEKVKWYHFVKDLVVIEFFVDLGNRRFSSGK